MVIISPRPSKTQPPAYEICGIALLQSRRPPLLLIHLGTTAAAFRVYSFSLFKAPHLPRSRERAPDPGRHRRLNTNATPARSRAERSGDAILGELAARNRSAALLRSGGNVTSGRDSRRLRILRGLRFSPSLPSMRSARIGEFDPM